MLEVKIVEVSVTQMGFAIVLKPLVKSRVVPIFIGPLETYSISTALENQTSERPLTHDLMKTMLTALGYKLEKVIVNNFKNGTFFARIFLERLVGEQSGEPLEIDARPSDAIAMAIRFNAPIYMNSSVYDKVAIDHHILKDQKLDVTERGSSGFEEEIAEEIDPEEDKDDLVQSILEEFENITHRKETDRDPSEKPKTHSKREDAFRSKREVLEQMLRNAVAKEAYEEAARIRDELYALKNKEEGVGPASGRSSGRNSGIEKGDAKNGNEKQDS